MAGRTVFVVLVVLVLLALVASLVLLARRRTPDSGLDRHPDLRRVHRHTLGLRLAGVLGGVVVGGLMLTDAAPAWLGGLGLSAALAPAIAGAVLVLTTAVGELTAPRSLAVVRTATLERRRVRDVLPRGAARAAAGGAGVLAGLLALGAALGSADDLGRAGRVLATACRDASGTLVRSSSHGPWPGSFYAVPMAVGLVVVLAGAALALSVVARRARPGAEGAALDSRLREGAARHVLLSVSTATWAAAAPLALLMASGLHGVEACPPAWFPVAAVAALLVGLGSLVLAVASFIGLLSGARLVPSDAASPQRVDARR